jgi:predicted MFS family arabinose efflux permease
MPMKMNYIFFLKKYRPMMLMLLMLMLASLDGGAIAPLWGDYIKSIGGGLQAAGIAVAILNIGAAVFTVVFSAIEVKLAKYTHFFVIFAFLLFAVFYLCYFFIDSTSKLYACLVGIALANGMVWPAFDALYQTTFEEDKASLAWGAQVTFENIGCGVGAYLGAHIANGFNFHFLFAIMFATSLIAAFFSFIGLPKKPVGAV